MWTYSIYDGCWNVLCVQFLPPQGVPHFHSLCHMCHVKIPADEGNSCLPSFFSFVVHWTRIIQEEDANVTTNALHPSCTKIGLGSMKGYHVIKSKHCPLVLSSTYYSIKCMIVGSIRLLYMFEVILIYYSFKCLNLPMKNHVYHEAIHVEDIWLKTCLRPDLARGKKILIKSVKDIVKPHPLPFH